MSALEFAATRHNLGLSFDDLATILGVGMRSVQYWESGHSRIPQGVVEELDRLDRENLRLAISMAEDERIIALSRDKSAYPDRPRGFYIAALGRALAINPDLMAEWA
ncbi:helix-turn-helix domain-containing protein [Arcanobacterium canis]